MPRRGAVRVQMADEADELPSFEQILASSPSQPEAAVAQRPGPDDPDPTPVPGPGSDNPSVPPDQEPAEPNEPEPDDDNGETPDEEDGEEIPSGDDDGSPADPPHSVGLTPEGRAPLTAATSPPPALDGEISPPGDRAVRYEARIQIVDAWRYPGTLTQAPPWIDRNWAAFADSYDPVRNLEPGPALRVPTYRGDTVYCRVGDYVAQQEVKLTADEPGEIKIEVWEAEQFQRLFIPVPKGAPDYVRPYSPGPVPTIKQGPTPPT